METEEKDFEEVDWSHYFGVIRRQKYFIAAITAIVTLATAAISLVMTPIYESRAVISPITQGAEPSGVALLAAQFGLPASNTTSLSELTNLLNSNILRERVIKRYNLLPELIDYKEFATKTENEQIWEGLRRLKNALNVAPKMRENVVTVSMEFKEPRRASDIVGYILTELNEHMSGEAKRVAETNKKYLESQIDKTSDPFIRAKIYALIAQQIEKSMMAEVKENFAFKVLAPPRVPDKRIKPQRTFMVSVAFLIALFVAIFLAFFRQYFQQKRKGQ
ncbi:MAG: Wzz/FepE/Etk N-terminal domain-containing protein [candidate division WOR-3 bacterium]